MPTDPDKSDDAGVLESKRNATRYQILVQIAERQPAVSQREIADAIGVTAQAVSDYLRSLVEEGYVDKEGRGRYEVTKEGVDWLISQTDSLRTYVEHVSEDVVGQVDVETAVAAAAVDEGDRVVLTMRDGVLCAAPDEDGNGDGGATAVAVTDADAGRDVGIANVEGVVDYDLGTVTVISVPGVQAGGSAAVDPATVESFAADRDLMAAAGTEALVAARAAGSEPDVRFGTPDAVVEAATKGLDVLLLAVTDRLSAHTDRLREGNIGYEVVDVDAIE